MLTATEQERRIHHERGKVQERERERGKQGKARRKDDSAVPLDITDHVQVMAYM